MRRQVLAGRHSCSESASIGNELDLCERHTVSVLQRGAGLLCGEGNRLPGGADHAEHLLLYREPWIDVADGEDGPVVVTAPQGVEIVRAAEAAVLRNDRRVGVGGLPFAPRRCDDRHRLEHNTRLTQRTRQCVAEERVEHRSGDQVVHHLVRTREQSGRPQDGSLDAVGHSVGEVGLGRTTQRAVRHPDSPSAECVIDHLVDLHDVPRVGTRLTVDDHGEDDAVVGVPAAAGRIGDGRVVECRNAAEGAWIRITQRAVVDTNSTPTDEAPVDVAVGVIEELSPAGLDERVQPRLVVDVSGRGGRFPGEEAVGCRLPG